MQTIHDLLMQTEHKIQTVVNSCLHHAAQSVDPNAQVKYRTEKTGALRVEINVQVQVEWWCEVGIVTIDDKSNTMSMEPLWKDDKTQAFAKAFNAEAKRHSEIFAELARAASNP